MQAYDAWAERYPPLPHNPLMRAEQAALLRLCPPAQGLRVLDLACGTGRYGLLLAEQGAAGVIGVDLSEGMLQRSPLPLRVRADMTGLPFAPCRFDLIVSGLAVGHAPSLDAWMQEAVRVLAPGGCLIYSDFHPDAARAGMTRSFKDAQGRRHELAHQRYDLADHARAAARAGLSLEAHAEVHVGRELCEPFDGSETFYRQWPGLAVVLVLRLGKAWP